MRRDEPALMWRGIAIVALLSACGARSALDDGGAGVAGGVSGGDLGGGAAGGSGASGGSATGGFPPGCDVALPGPEMVAVTVPEGGSFCIDTTEVTNDQYASWLAQQPATADQIASCAWNTSFEPTKSWPPVEDRLKHPVAWVDWCDADAYCREAGKRLCGALGGGSIQPEEQGEWMFVCTAGGTSMYPYGDEYQPNACNVGEGAFGETVAVGTPSCEGGFDGIFDMVGNVFELQDNCGPDPVLGPHLADCPVFGSSWFKGTDCAGWLDTDRDLPGSPIGFRCCRDAG